jgi:hypothetical protein
VNVLASVEGSRTATEEELTRSPRTFNDRPRRLRYGLAVAGAIYLALSLCLWSRVWITGDPASMTTCACTDPAQQLWWLAWFPQALLHGHNPFYSDALFARFGGISAMSNTSWMLPALVLSPITLLFGPIASSNVADLLAPVVSGVAAFALAAQFVRNFWARTVAGAVFGFSPFVMASVVLGHLNFTLVAYVPLALLVVVRHVRGEIKPVRAGLLLGLLTTAEFFVGVEVIVFTVVLASALLFAFALKRRSSLVAALPGLFIAGVTGLGLSAVALGYPIWVALFGRAHVMGPYWSGAGSTTPNWLRELQHLGAIVIPSAHMFSSSPALTGTGYAGPRGPGMDYVGLGIVIVLMLCAPVVRHLSLYAILAVAAVICALLESVPPGLWHAIPVAGSATPSRFALVVALLLGLMLALVVDGWVRPSRPWARRLHCRFGRRSGYAAGAVAVLVALAPIAATYSAPFVVRSAIIPRWFTNASSMARSETPLLILPFGLDRAESMTWEAETGIHSQLVWAYGFVRGRNNVDEYRSSLPVADFLQGVTASDTAFTASQSHRVRTILSRWSPLEVVLVMSQTTLATVTSLRRILGPPTSAKDGAEIWMVSR